MSVAGLTLLQLSGVWIGGFSVPKAPSGGGGSSAGSPSGYSYYNQAPSVQKKVSPIRSNKYLKQALREDEDMLVIFQSFIEIIKCH